MVSEIIMSICKSDSRMDKLIDNSYLETFLLSKYKLVDTDGSKSIIKHSCILNNIYKAKKKVSNTYWQINSSNFLTSHRNFV